VSTLSATMTEEYAQRYEALLRATNAIGTCRDCDTAADMLIQALREVVSFDYLQLVTFANNTAAVEWHVLYSNGVRQKLHSTDIVVASAVAWVHDSQQPLVTADWGEESRFPEHAEFLNELDIAATCVLPLARGERRLGVLSVGRSNRNTFPEDEVRFLGVVADQIALAIDAAVNFYLSRQAEERLKLILEVTNQVVSKLNFQELLQAISASVREVMRCDVAAIMLPTPDGAHLRKHALDFPDSKGLFTEDNLIPIEGTELGNTFRNGSPWVISRLEALEVSPEFYARAAGEGMNSFCHISLVGRDRSLGILSVASRDENAFEKEDVSFLSQVARQVAIGVENALAYAEIADLKDKLAQEKLYLEDEIRGEMDFEGIVGQSSALRHVLQLVETVAPSDSTVLLLGETGTGKELIARAIHERSRRKERTFVKLNCAAIPTGLLESELFGHERGAFTGAIAQKIGRLELADQGSLFLDEVGDIPIEIQPKLLRALQEREFERLGSTLTKRVDVRLVAATNRDLEKMMENREFRSDLYYRLNVFPIRIPPLRERPEDIPLLVRYFAQKYGRLMNKQIESIPASAMKKLSSWHWPGNIRELENFIERSVILTHGAALQAPVAELGSNGKTAPVAGTRDANQRDEIVRILKATNGRVAGDDGAAARMGLKRTTLIARMKKLGIDPRRVSL
jgi:formate hydrogenlyase transcriptional activator